MFAKKDKICIEHKTKITPDLQLLGSIQEASWKNAVLSLSFEFGIVSRTNQKNLFLIFCLYMGITNQKTVPAPSFTSGKRPRECLIGQFTSGMSPSDCFNNTTVAIPYLHEVRVNPGIWILKPLFPLSSGLLWVSFTSLLSTCREYFSPYFNDFISSQSFPGVLSNSLFRALRI